MRKRAERQILKDRSHDTESRQSEIGSSPKMRKEKI